MIHMINTPPWVDSIRRNFDFIAKHLLPRVNAEDDGKILSVVDGEWKPSDGGSSGGVLMCTITEDADTGVKSLGKSYADLVEAFEAGLIILAKEKTTDESLESTIIYMMAEIYIDSGIYGSLFVVGGNSMQFNAESDTDELYYDPDA